MGGERRWICASWDGEGDLRQAERQSDHKLQNYGDESLGLGQGKKILTAYIFSAAFQK